MAENKDTLITKLLKTYHRIANEVSDSTKIQRVTEMAICILRDTDTISECDGAGEVLYGNGFLTIQMYVYDNGHMYGFDRKRFTIQIATPIKSPKGDVSEDPICINIYEYNDCKIVTFTIYGARRNDFKVITYRNRGGYFDELMTTIVNAIRESGVSNSSDV